MFGAMLRSIMVAVLILIVGVFFDAVTLVHPLAFLFYVTSVAGIFSLLGMLVALWANGFEQLSILNTFIITPFTYLGGVFYSITMLPPLAQTITRANPFFYFVDGLRNSMTGVHEAHTMTGLTIILGILAGLTVLTVHLFKIGWRIRS